MVFTETIAFPLIFGEASATACHYMINVSMSTNLTNYKPTVMQKRLESELGNKVTGCSADQIMSQLYDASILLIYSLLA